MTLKTKKNTGGSVLTIFGRSDVLGIFLKEMDFRLLMILYVQNPLLIDNFELQNRINIRCVHEEM